MQMEFVVRPLELPDHPQRATHGDQHPEKIFAPMRSSRVQKKTCVRDEGHYALSQVSENGKSRLLPWQH